MKNLFTCFVCVIVFSSCTVTIPLQTNLSDQTMLLAENRNIKANYELVSDIPDGYIPYVSVMKNGKESLNSNSHKYASATAFKKMWGTYFSNKFNTYAEDRMDIKISLKEIMLKEKAATSLGVTMLTGNSKVNVDAVAIVHVEVKYHGETFENQFEVTASEYNESQQMQLGDYSYTLNQKNPTQQKSELLESCLNKSVIQFENFLRSIMLTDKKG